MSRTLKAEGDRWTARLGEARGERRPVLFFCTTTDQRPYRVVEVEASRFASDDDLEALGGDELGKLFEASRSMGAPRGYPTYPP